MNDIEIGYINTFNSKLKQLIKFACTKEPKLKIGSANKRISLLINEAPLLVLELSGPYIFAFGDQIKSRDDTFFLDMDTTKHIESSHSDDNDKKLAIQLIDTIRKIWVKCTKKEQAFIADLSEDLLINFCGYLQQNGDPALMKEIEDIKAR